MNYFIQFSKGVIIYYFYPELKSFIESNPTLERHFQISFTEVANFETSRQRFETKSALCSIIRDDLIEDFIQYVHQTNISLSSFLKRSFFDTNPILIEKEPTLIEYAAFYGSIQIMKYLETNNVEIKPSIWLYAVHSNNAEIIAFLEDKQIDIDDRTFSEAIKCHHNDIARYIYENYLDSSMKITDLSDENVLSIYSSNNYEFFSDEIDGNNIFFSLFANEYNELTDLYIKLKEDEIKENIIQQKNKDTKRMIKNALNENKLDVVYHLFMEFNCVPKKYFSFKNKISKIVLPPTIKLISDYAFSECSSLTRITIPSSVTSIGKYAFSDCSSLKQITIPSSVTSIGEFAFMKCSSLTRIIIPSSVSSINVFLFFNCFKLDRIAIPSSVTSIKPYAFVGCSSLRQITIPSSVTSIGDNAFCRCSHLTQITIPSSVTSIGKNAFSKCSRLTKAKIPSSINSIGEGIFHSCFKLNEITILQDKEERIMYFEDSFLIYKSNQALL